MASGTLTPDQLKQYQGITDPNAKFQFLQGVSKPPSAPTNPVSPPTNTPPSINASHSVGSYTSPPPPNSGIQSQIDDLRKQYDTSSNPQLRDAIHNQVAKLEASRGGVYNSGTGTYSYPTPPAPPDTSLTDSITKDYMNGIDAQTQAINQALAQAIQASNLAVGQNKQLLDEQIAKLQQQKQVNDQNAITLQNRRGGFYSGGLDYQLGNIASSTTQAQGSLERDIAARNADIYSKNALLAQQASQNIGMLQQQAPDKIRQLVQDAIQKQQDNARADAPLTGMYNGQPTYNAMKDARDYQYQKQQDTAANNIKMEDAKAKQMQEQRGYFTDLVNASDKLGYVVPELAQIIGVKPYSKTLSAQTQIEDAKYKMGMLDVSQQNADSSSLNAHTNASNAGSSKISHLIEVWKATNKAPDGLQDYGVQPGTAYGDGKTAQKVNMNDIVSQLNKSTFVQINPDTKRLETFDQKGLAKSILSLNLSKEETDYLFSYYNINKQKVLDSLNSGN